MWFNVKRGYGFVNYRGTSKGVFVYQISIAKNKRLWSSNVVNPKKEHEAVNVTRPNDTASIIFTNSVMPFATTCVVLRMAACD